MAGSNAPGGSSGVGGSASGAGGSGGSSAGGSGNGGSAGTGGSAQPDGGAGGSVKDSGATDGSADAAPAYNPCPAKGAPCAIMGLGDSITDGVGSSTGGSYRTFLYQLALDHGQNVTMVGNNMTGPNTVAGPDGGAVTFPKGNEGHSGFTIDDGGGRTGIHNLTAPAMTKFHPNIITLMIGTNDVDIMLDLPNAGTRLGALMDTILTTDPNVLLVVAKIVPTKDDNENVRVQAYNDKIPALVQARAAAGKHVIMVDMYGAFTANANFKTDYMSDNLHPKDGGYTKMADVWYAAIGSLFR
jgi:lysophospholipase L1-like esterase